MRFTLTALLVIALTGQASGSPWRSLCRGLDLATFRAPELSRFGDSKITVLRIDPKRAHFVLLSSVASGEAPKTAREWARTHHLRAVINAGMFDDDRRPVAYMRIGGKVVNGALGSQNTVFLAGHETPAEPSAQLVDRTCQDYPSLTRRYKDALQSLRVISCRGRIVWSLQRKMWSMALLGMDHHGRLLMIHCRSPYPVHRLAAMLQGLPLDLGMLMYLEGGPEATLYVHAGGVELEKVGSYETGFFESDRNDHAWSLPNVLGVSE